MRARKIGTQSYYQPFHVGYINPRLNPPSRQDVLEEEVFMEVCGHLMEAPDPDEEMEGTWHIEHNPSMGFIDFNKEEEG